MANQNISIKERIKLLKKTAKELGEASKWGKSGRSIAKINLTTEDEEDYIYELYCTFKLLSDLILNYEITIVKGDKYGFSLPRKPGLWKNFPYFKLRDKISGDVFDVHLGVFITKVGKKVRHAPDISITNEMQKNVETISPSNCIFVIDCKFKYEFNGSSETIVKGQYYYVSGIVRTLSIRSPQKEVLKFNKFFGLIGNALFTNANAAFDDPEIHKDHDVMEIENLEVNNTHRLIGFS